MNLCISNSPFDFDMLCKMQTNIDKKLNMKVWKLNFPRNSLKVLFKTPKTFTTTKHLHLCLNNYKVIQGLYVDLP